VNLITSGYCIKEPPNRSAFAKHILDSGHKFENRKVVLLHSFKKGISYLLLLRLYTYVSSISATVFTCTLKMELIVPKPVGICTIRPIKQILLVFPYVPVTFLFPIITMACNFRENINLREKG